MLQATIFNNLFDIIGDSIIIIVFMIVYTIFFCVLGKRSVSTNHL